MTVADLIRELQSMPNQHADVRILHRTTWYPVGPDWHRLEHDLDDAGLAQDVRNQGGFVCIEAD